MKTFCITVCLLMLTLSRQIVYAQQPLAQQAFAIFEQHCLDCHGEFGSYSDVLTIKYKDLIENRSVIPGQPGASEFYLRLLDDTDNGSQMPLGQEPLDSEAIATIRRWIEVGAPDWEAIPKPKRSFITTEVMLKTIHTHVTSLTAFDRSFARYFTLTHLYNAGASDDNLRAYRNALSKLVNSLSWGSEVIKPKPIDREETIFYIDLRHYEWDIKSDKWYKIEQAYPYGVQLKSPTYTTLCQETDCELPFIRADWFIATASLPPLYHEILDLPKTDRELETQLEVNVSENLKNAPGVRVWRAGFNESGVSINNRIVERHKSRYGAYWKSYDFAGNVGTQNIFTHPLDFTHDGGEIIFNLPNGLQAYYLSTAKGERLDEAPINIVSNAGARDPVVRNGLSCMGCHTEGMKTFEDQVRSVIEQNPNPPYDKAQALRLYAKKSKMDSLVREDIARYRRAIEATGGIFGGSEPIQQLVKQFEGPLDATQAAAELGLDTFGFLQKIRENKGLQNAGLLVLAVEKGTVKRDAWESKFREFSVALKFLQPDSANAYRIRGLVKYARGEYESAISDFDDALRLKPDSAEIYIGRGLAKAGLGQYGGAITDYNNALRLKPGSAEIYTGRGLAKAGLGQYEGAITDYDETIRLEPDSADAYSGRGLANLNLGRYEAAISDFDVVLRLKPDFFPAYYERGRTRHLQKDYAAAITDYDEAIRLKPDFAGAYHARGLAKGNLGRISEGKQDLRTALKLAEQTGNQDLKGEIEQFLQELGTKKISSQLGGNHNADMVLIPAGEFQMGSNDGDVDEKPVHTVYVNAFYIDKYEVTNAQYKAFVDTNPEWRKDRIPRAYHDGDYLTPWNGNNYPIGKGNHPVTHVSWYAAMAYAQWAGKRLPTEAEWEKSARGGLIGQKYPWGNLIDSSKANYDRSIGGTTPVGQYAPNTYGLYDMAGNVWEWCLDAYHKNFYTHSPHQNPVSGGNISNIISDFTNVENSRALRGGSWYYPAPVVRCTNRYVLMLASTENDLGFRCVMVVKP